MADSSWTRPVWVIIFQISSWCTNVFLYCFAHDWPHRLLLLSLIVRQQLPVLHPLVFPGWASDAGDGRRGNEESLRWQRMLLPVTKEKDCQKKVGLLINRRSKVQYNDPSSLWFKAIGWNTSYRRYEQWSPSPPEIHNHFCWSRCQFIHSSAKRRHFQKVDAVQLRFYTEWWEEQQSEFWWSLRSFQIILLKSPPVRFHVWYIALL